MQQDIKSTETSPLLAESRQQIAKAPGSDGASTADGSNLGDEREGWSAVTESHEGQEQQDMKKDQVEATSDARKQLKFTFPAMAVGVSLINLAVLLRHCSWEAGLPCRHGPDPCCLSLRQDWQ